MLLRISALLLLCLSSGMCATLGHYKVQAQEDNPPTEVPALDTAATEAPEVELVVADGVAADTPEAEALADDKPVVDEPEAEAAQVVDMPVADAPAAAEESVTDSLVAGENVAEDPVANNLPEDPVADSPEAEEPLPDSLAAEEPAAEDPVADSPAAAEEPLPDSLAAEEPAAEDPVADSPAAAEEPLPDSLAAEEPAAEDPVADSPTPAEEPAVESPMAGVAEEEPAPDTDAMMGDMPAVDAPAMNDLTEEALAQEAPAEEELGNEIEAVPESQQDHFLAVPPAEEEESSWGLGMIRGGFQTVTGYFESLVELVGGHNGICQYRCSQGEPPQPRPGFQPPEPNGCSSSLVGFQFDLGIPVMTQCCDLLDTCYDTCGSSKYRCDSKFRWCLHGICSDLKKSLGLESKVQACETLADSLYSTVGRLGCKPYMNSQRAACVCEGEEKDEL